MNSWRVAGKRLLLVLLGVAAFVAAAISLEEWVGVPFELTYRLACATICLVFMTRLGRDYPAARWPVAAIVIAAAVNCAIMLSPLMDRPPSRGEIMLFALPDAVVFLALRTATYEVADQHQRAVRQQLILGLVLAVAFCAIILGLALIK